MSVLLHRRREVAEAHIEALEKHRKEVVAALQKLHKTGEAIVGKIKDPGQLLGVLNWKTRGGTLRAAATQLWLVHSGYQNLPIRTEALESAIIPTKELSAFIDAAEDVEAIGSADPAAYWNGTGFIAKPATPDERAAIMERAEVRTKTEDHAELYKSAERLVNLANLRNRAAGVDLVKLYELTTGANTVYNGLIKLVPAGPHPLDLPQFEVDDTAFDMVRSNYRAFDEPIFIR